MDIGVIDNIIDNEIKQRYEGYRIENYASGYGGGVRKVSYDVFLKDGSRFIVDATYLVSEAKLRITEREYVEM